jgi:hypothetical protein
MVKHILGCIAVALMVGCSPSPAPPVQTSTPAPVEQAAQPAPSVSRADAMIEDMRRREAAQAKLDRESPPPPVPRLEDLVRPSAPAAATTAAPTAPPATTGSTAPSPSPSVSTERDEKWWKNEMRTAQVRLQNSVARWEASVDQMKMAQRQMEILTKGPPVTFAAAQDAFNRATAEANRYKAESENDRAAVDRIREDARRAGVPPGWLRWP